MVAQLVNELRNEVMIDMPVLPTSEIYQVLNSEFPIKALENDQQHAMALTVTERLIDFCHKHGGNQDIYEYLDALATFIERYEKKRYPSKKVSPSEMLAYLMSLHDLKQGDLEKELGGQSVVSELLHGKRELNLRQIRGLAGRFHVSPAIFI